MPPRRLRSIRYVGGECQARTRHKMIRDDLKIPQGTDIVYGACWYQSALQKDDHIYCFVLKLDVVSTSIDDSDVARLDRSYRYWN